MKFITCASYYATGSSAITDLINECDNVHDMGNYEFRFIQDPDGIRDLDYNLVENNHRHNSGYALKRYERNVKFLAGNKLIKKYNRFFGENWKKLSAQYVKDLTAVEYKGAWHYDLRDKGFFAYVIERSANRIGNKFFKDKDTNISIFLRNNTNYATNPGPAFYEITKKYIEGLFSAANTDNKEFVMADQLVPPSNVGPYLRYFDDIKVVCVERDPRDVFLLEKKWHGTIVPAKVEDFVIWYRATRSHRKTEIDDTSKVLRVQFEDLIYKYDETSSKVLEFCGIDKSHHVNPRKLLNPDVSIKNTRLWDRMTQYSKDIEYIEKELSEYLYDYSKVSY